MKLKKIASLALAGIMAVSMLAGCSNEGNTPDNNEEDNQVVANGNAATYAADALSAELKEYITVKSSSTLDGWVKDIATNKDKFGSNDIKWDYTTVFGASAGTSAPDHQKTLRDELKKKVVDSNVVYNDDINDGFEDLPKNNSKTQTSSILYVMSGMLDEKSAVESVVSYLTNGSISCPPAIGNSTTPGYPTNTHNCEYDVEISAVKVTNDSLNGESAWVIGVVITQTVTAVANTTV